LNDSEVLNQASRDELLRERWQPTLNATADDQVPGEQKPERRWPQTPDVVVLVMPACFREPADTSTVLMG